MDKFIRIELVDDERNLHAMSEDIRLGIINEGNVIKVEKNDKLPSGVSIGPKMVDDFIKETHISTIGGKTTLVRVVLKNGFEIIESSACVDPANYSEEIGAKCCLEKIKDKIWYLLGFLLQTAYHGAK